MYDIPSYRQQEARKRAEGLVLGAVLSGLTASFSWVVFAALFVRDTQPGSAGLGMTDVLLLALSVWLSMATAVLSICAFVQSLHNEQIAELEKLAGESRELLAEVRARSPDVDQQRHGDQYPRDQAHVG